MRDPNSANFLDWQERMATGNMMGQHRPVGRVTLGRNVVRGHLSELPGPWRNILFEQPRHEELFNITSISINRSIDQDSATCSIQLYNDDSFPHSDPQGGSGVFRPGYLTPYRGRQPDDQYVSAYQNLDHEVDYPTSFGYPDNEALPGNPQFDATYMKDRLIPNRLLRTYQGYGSDNIDVTTDEFYLATDPEYVAPYDDSKLVVTGTWLIDTVTFGSNGIITIECRDLAKLLLEQFIYPHMIPLDRFPLVYSPVDVITESIERPDVGQDIAVQPSGAQPNYSSSNFVHVGDGPVYGHTASMAFDGRPGTWWLSVGNATPDAPSSFEYIQSFTRSNEVNEVELLTLGVQYTVYVSVYEDGAWQGAQSVPYTPSGTDNGAAIPYVAKVTTGDSSTVVIKLDRFYRAEYVRVTFGNLHFFQLNAGETNKYRAAVRQFQVRANRSTVETRTTSTVGKPGEINDWSTVVKELCGWAGFTWYANPVRGYSVPADPVIGTDVGAGVPLRIWGDVEIAGAGPQEETTPEWFINKSFMEGVNQVKDMLGFVFFIDEFGGIVFRQPNIWTLGNFITDPDSADAPGYIDGTQGGYTRSHPIEMHENANLIDYSVVISDSQLRSEILVIGEQPNVHNDNKYVAGGAVLVDDSGANPVVNLTSELAGQTRLFFVPGEQTKGFKTSNECQRMAEMVALFINFTYRRGQVTAPCHPGLQIDDQVRIFERMTNETYVHYVSGLSTEMDLESGTYTMSLTTHWLGSDPDQQWFLDYVNLTDAVLDFPAVKSALQRGTE